MPIDDEDVAQNFLCFRCVGESYFSAEIRAKGIVDDCSYCGQSAESYRISEVADRIENVFDEHFFRTSNEPDSWQYTLMNDSESTYNWEREGEEVTDAIMNAADMPEEAAEDAQSILQDKHSNFDSDAMGEETPFSCDSYYSEKGANDRAWQEDWRTFEMQLKTEARFFSRTAAKHLDSVFRGIETFSTRSGGHSVVEWGPSTSFNYLYRARVFQSPSQLDEALNRPDLHLGPPPARLAAAGRMNARGISVFYGASDPLVAVAEVRPPVGSQVAVARFEIRRSLRLLDLTALADVVVKGSIFDPQFGIDLERAMFLRSLSARLTRPVMPDDEPLDYLPTQAVADFLATEASTPLDGIIYPSGQAAGEAVNVVLFHKSAEVERMTFPEGTTIKASQGYSDEEGWVTNFAVTEEVPSATNPEAKLLAPRDFFGAPFPSQQTPIILGLGLPMAALRIDTQSIYVHTVKRVEIRTEEHQVTRRRIAARERKF